MPSSCYYRFLLWNLLINKMDNLTPSLLWELFKHLRQWLTNLRRAGQARKQASITALRKVIVASRETQVYLRQQQTTEMIDYATERQLTQIWTTLGFDLADLDLAALAKRCQITGKLWANPTYYDASFVEKADISLERMEKLAQHILYSIEKS